MVDVSSYYHGDQFLRMNGEMGMYYPPQMYPLCTEPFNCSPYLPQGALAQGYNSPLNLTNIPIHNYAPETPTTPYLPPCTPMSQNSYLDQSESPDDISPFQTPPQKLNYYPGSSDHYSSNVQQHNLQNEMNLNLLPQTPTKSESTESEDMSKEDGKNTMSQQIVAILEQQGPTANGKRKRIKKGTLTESQKLFLRRERNRVAATKCREKRKQQSSVTKIKYDDYSEKNRELHIEIERLERQKEHLLRILESHNCKKIQTSH